jgi:hypothetical protein
VTIRYLNTDLDLIGPSDLTRLAAAFKGRGVASLHLDRGADGLWRATFETERQYTEPDANIAEMLGAVEALAGSAADDWRACTLREFNIGYDCGREPHAFNQALSLPTLRRMVDAGAALRVTLYPADCTESDC